jgi:MFS family permease
MNINNKSLVSEALAKLSAQAGFTALLFFAFQRGVKVGEVGFIAVAMLLPSLLWTWHAQAFTRRFSPRTTYLFALTVRSLVLIAFPFIAVNVILASMCSAAIGLLTQAINTSKLVFDGGRISLHERAKFNASRSLLGSMAVVAGPSLAGLVTPYSSGLLALVLAGSIGLAGALFLCNDGTISNGLTYPQPLEIKAESPANTWKWLQRYPELLVLLSVYVTIIAVLEMEFPIVFPFVREIYHRGADVSGTLLGICGIGSLLGGAFMHWYQKPMRSAGLTILLAFDGVSLFLATFAPPLSLCYFLFFLMGIVSSVSMITVETEVQNTASSEHQAFLFALMAFVGGAGGAVLTLISTQMADLVGSGKVLRSCATFEIALSLLGTLVIVLMNRKQRKT